MEEMQQGISGSVRALAAWKRETQADLGRLLGLSPVTVAHRLNGRLAWSLQDVETLCKHYGVTMDQLAAGPPAWLGLADERDTGPTIRYHSHADDVAPMAA
jgi:transcriptional regulator with XRE-family HTH domain